MGKKSIFGRALIFAMKQQKDMCWAPVSVPWTMSVSLKQSWLPSQSHPPPPLCQEFGNFWKGLGEILNLEKMGYNSNGTLSFKKKQPQTTRNGTWDDGHKELAKSQTIICKIKATAQWPRYQLCCVNSISGYKRVTHYLTLSLEQDQMRKSIQRKIFRKINSLLTRKCLDFCFK